ncbi:hypothetical protein [Methylorubrum aminovorans]|nr:MULTISPECIES: hypothetical protein [unclassified Methylobacterium]QIJ74357.1 hypothetical protein CLZ_07045 [Methylobacterium sp. CLZ]QIJ79263.1 hypothetical protein GU700_07045 [Methylobacterium sp. NI91]
MCASPSVNAPGRGDAAGGPDNGAAAHMPSTLALRRYELPRCGAKTERDSNALDGRWPRAARPWGGSNPAASL